MHIVYVTNRFIQWAGLDGTSRQAFPGQIIPDFDQWPYASKKVLLRMKNVHQRAYASKAEAIKQHPELGTPEPSIEPQAETHVCDLCQRTFKTMRSLSVHKIRGHQVQT